MEVGVDEDDDSEAPFEDGVGVEAASVLGLGEAESVVDDTATLGNDPVPLGTICRYCRALSIFIAQIRVKIVKNRNAMFAEERICLMVRREKRCNTGDKWWRVLDFVWIVWPGFFLRALWVQSCLWNTLREVLSPNSNRPLQ